MRRRAPASDDGWLLTYADLITNLLIFFVMMLAASETSRSKMQMIAQGLAGEMSSQSLSSIQKEIEERIEKEGLKELIETDLTDEGLELSLNSGVVFSSGKAAVRAEMIPVLERMLATLEPYSQKYEFAVEGHTDSKPINEGSAYLSNWELSADRANAVRRRLEAVGVSSRRIRVEGYADTQPLAEEELVGLSEEERLASHRRVVVRVY